MDRVEELRRVVRGYRQITPKHSPPAGLLDAIRKLDLELGPGTGPAQGKHLPAQQVTLEKDLTDVAQKLVREGGVSHVAGTLLHGILAQLATPGRPAEAITEQPNTTGQIPQPEPTGFPSPR